MPGWNFVFSIRIRERESHLDKFKSLRFKQAWFLFYRASASEKER